MSDSDSPQRSSQLDLRAVLRLLVLTDAELAAPRPVTQVVLRAVEGGATSVQLRMKGATAREVAEAGRELHDLLAPHGIPLFLNDRADVAVAIGADGVHVGPDDPAVLDLRRAYGSTLLIGASTDDPDVARQLEAEGADYIGCGAVFPTGTKDVGNESIGATGLAAVAAAVDIPVVGIGGITPENAGSLADTRAAGIAVVSAIMAAADPEAAARALRSAIS